MRGTYLGAFVAVVAVAAAATTFAAAQQSDNYDGTFAKKADKNAVMGLYAVSKHGKIVKVTNFDWDGFLCNKGQEGFTGGASGKPFEVTDGAFHGKRSVSFKAAQVTAKIKGQFSSSEKKVTGTIKLGGDCSWKDRFTAKPRG